MIPARPAHAAVGLVCAGLAASVLAVPAGGWPALATGALLLTLLLWLAHVLRGLRRPRPVGAGHEARSRRPPRGGAAPGPID